MWKILIIFSFYISSSISFKIGNLECATAPEQQSFARIHCSNEKCEVTCIEGYKFPNGENKLELSCFNDQRWIVASYGNIPECSASCTPACLNGGKCIATNQCQCPFGFTGHRCQTEIKVS